MLVRRLAVTEPEDRERTIAFKRFTYEGLVERARGEIAWAQRGLKLIDELGGTGRVQPNRGIARV
jgi:hypothetical protein